MLVLFLLFVEEDVFTPELPSPEVKPEVEWFSKIERNWINMALNREVDYNYAALKFHGLNVESVSERDFADHYQLKASLKSLSYTLNSNYTKWDDFRFSKTTGSKWLLEEGRFLLAWFEAFSFQDSLAADVEVRFYQLVSPFFIGGWANYKESVDYGLIVQVSSLRGELGKERRCVGFVNDYGEIKMGRFRDRFPSVFYPIQSFIPRVRVFHGARINIFSFKIDGGRKYFYTEGEEILGWKKGEVYFANIEFDREKFGFQYFHQNKGAIREFGKIHASSDLGFIGSEVSLTGYRTPRKYLTGGFSLWLRTRISPFVSLRNLSWSPGDDFQGPVYYLGIRYAD